MKPHHRNHRHFKDSSRRKIAEATAGSVDEAIIKALTELRVPKERARIEVLDEGKPKILGLFGGRPAKVRATLKGGFDVEAPDRGRGGRDRDRDQGARDRERGDRDRGERRDRERGEHDRERGDRDRGGRERQAFGERGERDRGERRDRDRGERDRERGDRDRGERGERDRGERGGRGPVIGPARAEEMRAKAAEMLRLMGAEPEISAEELSGELWLKVASSPMDGVLIGRRGETLTAMEHLLTRMSSMHDRDRVKVVLDVGGYRSRKGGSLPEGAPGDEAEEEAEGPGEPFEAEAAETEGVEGEAQPEFGERPEGRSRRRRGRRGRGGRGGALEPREVEAAGEPAMRAPMEPEERELVAPRGFEPRGPSGGPEEPEDLETHGGALLDEDEFEELEEVEPAGAEEEAAPEVGVPAVDPEDQDSESAFYSDRGRGRDRGGRGGRGGRDRGGRGGRDRDRDRGGRGRDRGERPDIETTPEMRAKISESKRLEQELLARMAESSESSEAVTGAEPETGPKLPSFRVTKPKRRGYMPPPES